MKLLIQPADGTGPLVKAVQGAKRSVEIAIFRFDLTELEKALAHAVTRGVAVHALIAHTNRAGEDNLRRLELRLLAAGVTVARTADDLLRYHGKYMIVDRSTLYVLGYNLTHLDAERSRSFGIVTRSREMVQEAVRLFEADCTRSPYDSRLDTFIVSPVNARRELAAFIQSARRELLIYDPKVSDMFMIRLLEERAQAGVKVTIIGKMTRKSQLLECRKLTQRLHTRTMVRDGQFAFLGSQSLRSMELDSRREVGLIFREAKIVKQIMKVFHEDWKAIEQDKARMAEQSDPAERLAKKVAKAIVKELPAVAPVVDDVVKDLSVEGKLELDVTEVEQTVKDAVKHAVQEAVKDAVEEAVEQSAGVVR
ncbi:MAG: phospholipase D-like domain-containing protein [Bryobacteraceae bacterium]